MIRSTAAVALLCVAVGASADTVYKCRASDGRIVYQSVPCAGGARLELPANAVGPSTPPELVRKWREADARINARIDAADAERDRTQREADAHLHRCRRYVEAVERQRPWLHAISAAVAASALAEIRIQQDRYYADHCDRVNLQ